jgi:site-specific recombinase XerD
MFARYSKSPSCVSHLLSRPSCSLLDLFAQHLDQVGYSIGSTCRLIRATEHLLYWADAEDLSVARDHEVILVRFAEHLTRCTCQSVSHAGIPESLRGARRFLAYYRGLNADTNSASTNHADQDSVLLSDFCQWMRRHRGTYDSTLDSYCVSLRILLKHINDDLSKLNAQCLRQVVLARSKNGYGSGQRCTTALRMFLRFLVSEGKCAAGMDAAIPRIAHWKLSALPKYLQEDEVERVIASCDLTTANGKRDRAILLLLARLGLRAGDIIQLRITDIDWKGASISVSGKSKRLTQLPLTQEVGQAIVDYLQQGRPRSDTEMLFVRALAPFTAFERSIAISCLVRRAMCRAGIARPSRGAAHVLRHSAATSMLRNGGTLQDIATILRHRSIMTTQIYAKVDVDALREIAQPWPEELSC